MTFDHIVFFEYSVIKLQIIEIVNEVLILRVSLGKVKLSININECIKSIVLTDVLYML